VSDRLPAVLLDTLREQWTRLDDLDKQIAMIEQRLQSWMKNERACKVIAEIPGVGLLTATAAVARSASQGTRASGSLNLIRERVRQREGFERVQTPFRTEPYRVVVRDGVIKRQSQQGTKDAERLADFASLLAGRPDSEVDVLLLQDFRNEKLSCRRAQQAHEFWPTLLAQEVGVSNENIRVNNNNQWYCRSWMVEGTMLTWDSMPPSRARGRLVINPSPSPGSCRRVIQVWLRVPWPAFRNCRAGAFGKSADFPASSAAPAILLRAGIAANSSRAARA